MDGNNSRRIDRLEAVLRAAQARREALPADPDLTSSVMASITAGNRGKPTGRRSAQERLDRLDSLLRDVHAHREQPAASPDLAASVLVSLAAGQAGKPAASPGEAAVRLDRLDGFVRGVHARRTMPPLDPGLAKAVVAALKAEDAAPEIEDTRMLWRMAAGAGFVAAATVLLALTFVSGLEDELGRLLFFDPSGQVVVSLLGV
jgi:hypothetical protein